MYVWIGFVGGPWLDHRFHTAPWFKVLGIIIAVGAPINALARIVRDYNKALKQDDASEKRPDRNG